MFNIHYVVVMQDQSHKSLDLVLHVFFRFKYEKIDWFPVQKSQVRIWTMVCSHCNLKVTMHMIYSIINIKSIYKSGVKNQVIREGRYADTVTAIYSSWLQYFFFYSFELDRSRNSSLQRVGAVTDYMKECTVAIFCHTWQIDFFLS